jgi:hypothetical protein
MQGRIMDMSSATDEEIKAEIAGAREMLKALMAGAPLGTPFGGREEEKIGDLRRFIDKGESILRERDATRP